MGRIDQDKLADAIERFLEEDEPEPTNPDLSRFHVSGYPDRDDSAFAKLECHKCWQTIYDTGDFPFGPGHAAWDGLDKLVAAAEAHRKECK